MRRLKITVAQIPLQRVLIQHGTSAACFLGSKGAVGGKLHPKLKFQEGLWSRPGPQRTYQGVVPSQQPCPSIFSNTQLYQCGFRDYSVLDQWLNLL